MNKKYFLELAQYNIWANNMMAEWLGKVNEEQWVQPLVGSFNSLEATAIHIAGAEKIWFERLTTPQVEPFLSLNFKGNREELLAIWQKASENLTNYVAAINEADLLEKFAYKNLKGEDFTNERYRAIAHVFNHSTYHRGQLINFLREVGFTAVGSTDLINFYRV